MNKIKYDKRDSRLFLILAITTTIVSLICFFLMNTKWIEQFDACVIGFVMAIGVVFLPVIAFATWSVFADSHTYLKRLEKYGYIVPANKKEYDRTLENLTSGEVKVFHEPSKESKALALISWVVTIAMVVYTIYLSVRFSHMMENVAFFIIVSVALAIFWLIFGINFWKQRNRDKYKDDVEVHSANKPRKHLVEGMITIIILLGISAIIAINMYTMSKYVEKSKEMQDDVVIINEVPKML